jgi:DNA polymerase-1
MKAATIIPFPTAFALGWREIRDAVREGHALGVRFRVAGAGIVMEESAGELPATLRDKLGAMAGDGRLFSFFRLEDTDTESLAYAERYFPDVARIVVTTRAEARRAVAGLIQNISGHRNLGSGRSDTTSNGYGGQTIWRNTAHDEPVTPIGKPERGPDGRLYQKIAESLSYIPVDELITIVGADGNGGHVAIDVETFPVEGPPRPPIQLNKDGAVSARAAKWENDAGLDPRRSKIGTLQLYAGGSVCYLFRGEGLKLVRDSHWLRRQHLVAHNALFELSFLKLHSRPSAHHRRAMGRLDCTMQAGGLVNGTDARVPERGRSLARVVTAMLDLPELPKGLQTSDWSAERLTDGQVAYACLDAITTWHLWPKLAEEIERQDSRESYELQVGVIPVVADMQQRGLRLDLAAHAGQIDEWKCELAAERKSFHAMTGEVPPSKPDEIRAWLKRVLPTDQYEEWKRTPTDELTIARPHVKRLIHTVEPARFLLRALQIEKLLLNFGPRLAEKVNRQTGRVHARYNIAAAKSGRFSSESPNLQQVPQTKAPTFKKSFVPAQGNVFVGGDWDQVELRGFGWITRDPRLNAIYRSGDDLHVITAASLAGISIEQVTAKQRQAAKPANYGAIYGIQAPSLRENAFLDYDVDMSIEEAQRTLDSFFNLFHVANQWRWDNYKLAKERGYLVIGCGRVARASWEIEGRLRFTQCCNLPVQGICADAMLRALRLVYVRLKKAGIRGGIVATIHDEILLEVLAADAERAREILAEAMVDAFIDTFPGAPTNGVVDVKIGLNWAELK